jgi:hypothetical protein
MESSIIQRNKAIEILQDKISHVSNVFRKGYLENGRGSLLLYIEDVITGRKISKENYRDRDDSLFLFDYEKSRSKLAHMIDSYDPKTQGIVMLISSDPSNATCFITVTLTSQH